MAYYFGKYSKSYNFKTHSYNKSNTLFLDKGLLKDLLSVQAPSEHEARMQDFVYDWIEENVPDARVTVDNYGNIYAQKGEKDIYPCVVAHMDEVNDFTEDRTIVEVGNLFVGLNPQTGEYAGCPGDDRVGCYMCLEMLRVLPDIKVAFFVEEEIGGVGSGNSNLSFFKNCAFIAQADRMFNFEFITQTNGVTVSSVEFQDAVEQIFLPYNYSFGHGTFTDVGVLTNRGVGICTFNIGCGYYDSHSSEEKVCLPDVENCLNIIYYICGDLAYQQWKHELVVVPKKAPKKSSAPSIYPINQQVGKSKDWKAEEIDIDAPPFDIDIDFPSMEEMYDSEVLPCSKCRNFDCMNCDYSTIK
jgi:hypothetical protein